MKCLFITCCFFLSLTARTQDIPKFELTKDGVAPIVVNIENMNAGDIYKKTYNWIQETYKTPKEVLKTNIENEKIRVDGFMKDAWYFKSLGITNSYDMEYSLEMEFKDNKIRLTFTPGQFWADDRKLIYGYTTFFNSDGELRSSYKHAKPSMDESMNNLSMSLYKYITSKKSDW